MAKNKKALTKSAIAAALAASAVIPVAAAPAAAATSPVVEVVYVVDGQNAVLDFDTFTNAFNADANVLDIAYVKVSNGNYYTFDDFSQAFNASATLEDAVQLLTDATGLAKNIEVVPGAVVDGEVVIDQDTEAPVITVESETEITVANGAEFTVPVATATDNEDETVEVTTTITNADGEELEAIDTTVAGTYTITYTATDAAGNEAEAKTVTVIVSEEADTEAPVIEVEGAGTTVQVANGAEFTVPEATVTDNADEAVEVTTTITNAAGEELEAIDTTVAGTYTITYTATDASGNEAEAKTITVVVAEVVAPLTVTSVNTVTKTSVKVTLPANANATAAADKTSYTVTIGGEAVEVTGVVYIKELNQATLTVNLDGKAGKVAVNAVEATNAVDYQAPTVKSVTSITDKIIDVEFSEAMSASIGTAANYALVEKGTAIIPPIASVVKVSDTKARITLTTAQPEGKVLTLSVKDVVDASQNKIVTLSQDVTIVKDTVRPTLSSVEVTGADKVVLVLSKEFVTAPTVSIQKYNQDGTVGAAVQLNQNGIAVSGNKVTVPVADAQNYFENGAKYKVTVSGGTDIAGLALDSQSIDFTGVSDVTAPTITEQTFDNATKKLTLKFSEDVTVAVDDPATPLVNEAASYTLRNATTGAAVGNAIAPVVKDAKTLEFTLPVNVTGNYVLPIATGIQDKAVPTANALAANTLINVSYTAPAQAVTFNAVVNNTDVTKGNQVTLTFNQALTDAEGLNAANYQIVETADATKTLAISKVEFGKTNNVIDKTKVVLTTATQVEGTNYTAQVSNITNLTKDANKTYASQAFTGEDVTAPTLTTVKPVNNKVVDLTFDETLAANQDQLVVNVIKSGTAEIAGTYTVNGGNNNTVTPVVNGKTVRLTFTNALENAEYTISVKNVKDVNNNYQLNQVAPNDKVVTKTFTAQADTAAPVLQSVTAVNSAKLVLQFNEELSYQGTAAAYVFKDVAANTEVPEANLSFTLNPEDKTQIIVENKDNNNVLSALFENGKQYSVTINGEVADVVPAPNANAITPQAPQSLTFTGVDDTTAPKLASAVASTTEVNNVNKTKVVLAFDEAVTAAGLQADEFVVTNAQTFEPLTVTSATLVDGKVELVLDTPTLAGTQYRVYVSGDSIKDTAVTPKALDDNGRIATFTGVDTTAPTLTKLELKGTKQDNTATTATVTINNGTITVTNLVDGAAYNVGSFAVTEDIFVTVNSVLDKYDINTPVSVSKNLDSATIASIVSAIFTDEGVNGITTATIKANDGSTLTLTDAAGNATTYTIDTAQQN